MPLYRFTIKELPPLDGSYAWEYSAPDAETALTIGQSKAFLANFAEYSTTTDLEEISPQ